MKNAILSMQKCKAAANLFLLAYMPTGPNSFKIHSMEVGAVRDFLDQGFLEQKQWLNCPVSYYICLTSPFTFCLLRVGMNWVVLAKYGIIELFRLEKIHNIIKSHC